MSLQRILTAPFAALFPVLAALLLLAGCAGTGPYNTTSDGADAKLMLKGHDPVAYFTVGKHTPGKPEIKADHDGVTYRFASDENRQLFVKSPEKYAPQYGGFCTNGIVYGIPWGGDPDAWHIIDGRLFIFGGTSSRKYFLMDQSRNLQLADQYWKDEIKGSHGTTQRYKRLVFRVPHYKTGHELAAEWDAKQKGQPAPEPKRAL
jgi:YHS domain-containing protein